MRKRTTATDWEMIVRDETGAMVNVDYICPHCGLVAGNLISIGAADASKLEDDWETDQVCEVCGGEVTVECK